MIDLSYGVEFKIITRRQGENDEGILSSMLKESVTKPTQVMFEGDFVSKIDEILSSYKAPSDLIPILQKAQEEYGYLSIPALQRIEEKTGLPGAEIFGVATFYAQFRFKPQGKNLIKVCHGTACHVSGAENIEDGLRRELKVEGNEPTHNGLFSLERIACLGCCALAPVMMINKKCYGKLEPSEIKRVLAEYR